MSSGTMSEAASGASSSASSKASSEAVSAAKRSISEQASNGVVLRVNFAGPNRGLANETASVASNVTTSGTESAAKRSVSEQANSGASSHKGKRCTSNPIKDKNDINRMCEYFKAAGDYRMYAIFMVGINTAYRISDILSLRWGDILNESGEFWRKEKKTGKWRFICLNQTLLNALDLYRQKTDVAVSPEAYVFPASRSCYETAARQDVDRKLKRAVADLGIAAHAGTHLMRKTFAYHYLTGAADRSRALEQLMLLLGHSSPRITLSYAGITEDELRDAYECTCLGC